MVRFFFLMFFKEVSSAHQGCNYLIKNTVKTVILWNIIPMIKSCIFSIITRVFSVTWSFRNHYNMMMCCSRNISYYLYIVCCFFFFFGNLDAFFRILWRIESSKVYYIKSNHLNEWWYNQSRRDMQKTLFIVYDLALWNHVWMCTIVSTALVCIHSHCI